MEDFAYLCRDSNAAWLAGRSDGRYARYEAFYQSQREALNDNVSLEEINDGYGAWIGRQPSRLLSVISGPTVGKLLIALLAIYIAGKSVPALAVVVPGTTAGLLVAAFISLRVMHRRNRRR